MDPSYIESDDEAAAMAAAMGFSAFGTQGPPKKRRFNPATDAIVDGQALASLDKGGKKGQGSGGNNIPLGKPRVLGTSKPLPVAVAANEDEINLDDDDDGPAYMDTSRTPPAENEDGPQYVDLSRVAPLEESRETQERIDAILAGTLAPLSDPPPPSLTNKKTKASSQAIGGLGNFLSALHASPPVPASAAPGTQAAAPGLPARPPSVSGSVASTQYSGSGRQRNEQWYVGYYDAGFNENPWRQLEVKLGWEAKGTWVERPRREALETKCLSG